MVNASEIADLKGTGSATEPSTEFSSRRRVLAFATQGAGGDDEARLKTLLGSSVAEFFPFDRKAKRASAWAILKQVLRERPDLVVMEGTGLAGGTAVMLGRLLGGIPYVVVSGDAVGPFLWAIHPLIGVVGSVYERLLCRYSAGFIGWTPYLTGRAITFGAPRGATAPGWAPFQLSAEEASQARAEDRESLGIGRDEIVFGLVGSLQWSPRAGYCYGLELVKAAERLTRADARVLIVGDGNGRAELERLAKASADGRCIFTGRVSRDQVPRYLAAFDVAGLPQSLDGVGNFRYTTKISEYLSAGLPIVTGRLPFAYDLDEGWLWRIPGKTPWSEEYIAAIAEFMNRVDRVEIASKSSSVPNEPAEFARDRQISRVAMFLDELMDDLYRSPRLPHQSPRP